MRPSRLTRAAAFTCAVLLLSACSTAAPSSDSDVRSTDGVLADARRRPRTTTTLAPTTSAPSTTATPRPATTSPAPTTTVAPPVAPNGPTTDADRCAQLRQQATLNPARFHPSSTFNQPAACIGVRADSAKWSSTWFNFANYPSRTDASKRGHISVAFDAYSTPVYSTEDATTTVRVFTPSWGWGHNLGANNVIPWNPSWEPAAGNDLEMMIVNPTTGVEYGLWLVQKVNWSSCFTLENLLAGWRAGVDLCVGAAGIGKNPDGSVSDHRNSSGFSQQGGRGMGNVLGMALLPTLDEIEKGSINHALNMETYATMFGPACTPTQLSTSAAGVDCGYAVAPASRLEWSSGPAAECGSVAQQNTPVSRSKTVPEGMRFALDITDQQIETWLNGRGYTGAKRNTARIFAVALRDYGWIISDTTCWESSMAVEGVANPKARARWAQLGITTPASDGGSLLSGLITNEGMVRTLESPAPDLYVNAF